MSLHFYTFNTNLLNKSINNLVTLNSSVYEVMKRLHGRFCGSNFGLFFFICSVPEHELKEESRNMEAKQETVGKGFLLTQYCPTHSGCVGTDRFSVA